MITVGMVAYFVRFWRRYPHHRLAALALVACMILPYGWVVGYKELGQILPAVIALIGPLKLFLGEFASLFPFVFVKRRVSPSLHFDDFMARFTAYFKNILASILLSGQTVFNSWSRSDSVILRS